MTNQFNFEQALAELQSGKNLTGKDGILTPLIKQLTEAALHAELETHIASGTQSNRKNGYTNLHKSAGSEPMKIPLLHLNLFSSELLHSTSDGIAKITFV